MWSCSSRHAIRDEFVPWYSVINRCSSLGLMRWRGLRDGLAKIRRFLQGPQITGRRSSFRKGSQGQSIQKAYSWTRIGDSPKRRFALKEGSAWNKYFLRRTEYRKHAQRISVDFERTKRIIKKTWSWLFFCDIRVGILFFEERKIVGAVISGKMKSHV